MSHKGEDHSVDGGPVGPEVPPPPEQMLPYAGKYGNGLIFDQNITEAEMGCTPDDLEPQTDEMIWENPEPGDQGTDFSCVGFALSHWMQSAPSDVEDGPDPLLIYDEARKLDTIPGSSHDGTELRAGVQYLVDNGLVADFRWAHCIETIASWLLVMGPVPFGAFWSQAMIEPGSSGVLTVHDPPFEEGHCSLLIGFSASDSMFIGLNSWGPQWGDEGRFYISTEDLTFLLTEVYGEAALISMTPSSEQSLNMEMHDWFAYQLGDSNG